MGDAELCCGLGVLGLWSWAGLPFLEVALGRRQRVESERVAHGHEKNGALCGHYKNEGVA